eukprot:140457-Chlamydomonas_euryale.AAC.2
MFKRSLLHLPYDRERGGERKERSSTEYRAELPWGCCSTSMKCLGRARSGKERRAEGKGVSAGVGKIRRSEGRGTRCMEHGPMRPLLHPLVGSSVGRVEHCPAHLHAPVAPTANQLRHAVAIEVKRLKRAHPMLRLDAPAALHALVHADRAVDEAVAEARAVHRA